MFVKSISAENFLSFSKLDYEFSQEPTVIQGKNETDNDQKSNGSGKSAFLAIIEYCLLFTNSRGVRDAELISYGEESSVLKTVIHCPIREEDLEIEAVIKKKGSNKINLTINNMDVAYSNASDAKASILNWLGMQKEDIYSFFLINRSRFKSFFSYSNTERISITNRFSDSSILEGIENHEFSDAGGRLAKVEADITRQEGVRNFIAEQLSDYMNKQNAGGDQVEVNELQEDIKFLNEEIEEHGKEIASLEKQVETQNGYLSKKNELYDSKKEVLEKLNEKIDKHNTKISTIRQSINEIDLYPESISSMDDKILKINSTVKDYNTKLAKVEVKLGGSVECPNCSHEFLPSAEGTVKQYRKAKKLLEDNITLNEAKIPSIEEEIKKEKGKIQKSIDKKEQEILDIRVGLKGDLERRDKLDTEVSELKTEISSIEAAIKRLKSSIGNYEAKIKENNKEINEAKEEIESLDVVDFQEKIDNSFGELSEVLDEITTLKKMAGKVKEEIQNEEFWKGHFKHFKTFLANKSVKVIEGHTNKFLKDINSDLRVLIEGFKVLSSGKVKDNITPYIIRNGEQRSPSSLSAGELARVVYASILALQHLVNNENKYGGLKLLIIDEVLDSVDSQGLANLIEESKNLSQLVLLVSHSYTDILDVNNITIIKENGLSKVE